MPQPAVDLAGDGFGHGGVGAIRGQPGDCGGGVEVQRGFNRHRVPGRGIDDGPFAEWSVKTHVELFGGAKRFDALAGDGDHHLGGFLFR
jgi:hypothetical protein